MTYHACVVLRTLRADDLPALMDLKAAAGWNQTADDWLRMLRLEPGGCFGIESSGTIVASAAAVCYGQDLAWIGMVLTLPGFRGRGLARRLMERCIAYAGTRAVRLDASDQGRPLYESLGFVPECRVERWRRAPGPANYVPRVSELRFDPQFDREVFRADRSVLLQDLAAYESASVAGAYAYGRPGSDAAFFGPCIACDPESAGALFRWFAGEHSHEPMVTDLFPDHEHASRIASGLGFVPFRRLTRMMLRPSPVQAPDPRVYAIAGFEWG